MYFHKSKITKGLVWLVITLVLLEIAMRLSGLYRVYSEEIGKGYESYYNGSHAGWYHQYTPNVTIDIDHGDFKYRYNINSLGVPGSEFKVEKNDSVIRILTLGDSFTEGIGAPVDSTWPRFLQNDLAEDHIQAEVYNLGVSGSDPFYEYTLLRDKLLKYKPDVVLVAINSSDFPDYIFRGGFERFHSDSTTVYRKGPWFEPLYKHSRAFRLFTNVALGYRMGNDFIKRSTFAKTYSNAASAILTACDSIDALCKANACRAIIILHPTPGEIAKRTGTLKIGPWQYTRVLEDCKVVEEVFANMQQQLNHKNIPAINLWNAFNGIITEQTYLQYSYNHDGHFNATGYHLLEQQIIKDLKNKKIAPFNN